MGHGRNTLGHSGSLRFLTAAEQHAEDEGTEQGGFKASCSLHRNPPGRDEVSDLGWCTVLRPAVQVRVWPSFLPQYKKPFRFHSRLTPSGANHSRVDYI